MDVPNLIYQKMLRVENLAIPGDEKRLIVLNELQNIFNTNVKINLDDICEDLIELLIKISKKEIKLRLNAKSNCIKGCVVH
jgi:hypothetical protein